MYLWQKIVSAKQAFDTTAQSEMSEDALVPRESRQHSVSSDKGGDLSKMPLDSNSPSSQNRKATGIACKGKLVQRIGKKGITAGSLAMPCGIAVTHNGDIVVVDTDNHRVQIFSSSGVLKKKIGSRGSSPAQLHHPMCVALSQDTQQNILVTDSVNASLKVFRQDGTFLAQCYRDNLFDFPYGVAVSKNNFMVVTDLCRHAVVVLYPSGSKMTQFGCYGDGLHQLDHPYFVAIDNQDHVIVSDSGNTSVKTFTLEGTILQCFNMFDFKLLEEHFVILQGVTMDTEGNILIIGNTTVYMVAPNGRLWEVLLPQDGLHSPKCLAFSPLGFLAITQHGLEQRQEISIFKYNMADFRSLKSIPKSRVLVSPQLQSAHDHSRTGCPWQPRHHGKRARSSTSNSSVEDAEERLEAET